MLMRIKNLFSNLPLKRYLLYLCVTLFLTTGVTFSKYISSTTNDDSARVVEFGNLTLTETDITETSIFAPGIDIEKNPKVSFSVNETSAYVYVAITAEDWSFSDTSGICSFTIDDKLSWQVNSDDWIFLSYDSENSRAVFYTLVPPGEELSEVAIIKENKIEVSENIKYSDMLNIEDDIKIAFKAYAVQSGGFETADSAWNSIKNK